MIKNKAILIPVTLLMITLGLIFFMPDATTTNQPVITEKGKMYSENAHDLLERNRLDEATTQIYKALETSPNHPGWHFLAALIHFQGKKFEESIKELEITTRLRPGDVEAFYLGGLLSFKLYKKGGDEQLKESARMKLASAISIKPRHLHSNYFLGVINLEDGRIKEAIENFTIAKDHTLHTRHMLVGLSKKEEKQLNYLPYYYVGLAYDADNQLDEAIKNVKIASADGAAGGMVSLELGRLMVKKGEIEEGLLFAYRASLMLYNLDLDTAAAKESLAFIKQVAPQSEYIAKIEDMLSKPPVKRKKRKKGGYH